MAERGVGRRNEKRELGRACVWEGQRSSAQDLARARRGGQGQGRCGRAVGCDSHLELEHLVGVDLNVGRLPTHSPVRLLTRRHTRTETHTHGRARTQGHADTRGRTHTNAGRSTAAQRA
jgi:hypothetical protein